MKKQNYISPETELIYIHIEHLLGGESDDTATYPGFTGGGGDDSKDDRDEAKSSLDLPQWED